MTSVSSCLLSHSLPPHCVPTSSPVLHLPHLACQVLEVFRAGDLPFPAVTTAVRVEHWHDEGRHLGAEGVLDLTSCITVVCNGRGCTLLALWGWEGGVRPLLVLTGPGRSKGGGGASRSTAWWGWMCQCVSSCQRRFKARCINVLNVTKLPLSMLFQCIYWCVCVYGMSSHVHSSSSHIGEKWLFWFIPLFYFVIHFHMFICFFLELHCMCEGQERLY